MNDAERADWLEREVRWLRDEFLNWSQQPASDYSGCTAAWSYGEAADKLSDLLRAYGAKTPA
jgi:hypothetical protein